MVLVNSNLTDGYGTDKCVGIFKNHEDAVKVRELLPDIMLHMCGPFTKDKYRWYIKEIKLISEIPELSELHERATKLNFKHIHLDHDTYDTEEKCMEHNIQFDILLKDIRNVFF